MTYVYCCDACLDGDHEHCEKGRGDGICNCAHSDEETAFQRLIRERSARRKAERELEDLEY